VDFVKIEITHTHLYYCLHMRRVHLVLTHSGTRRRL